MSSLARAVHSRLRWRRGARAALLRRRPRLRLHQRRRCGSSPEVIDRDHTAKERQDVVFEVRVVGSLPSLDDPVDRNLENRNLIAVGLHDHFAMERTGRQ